MLALPQKLLLYAAAVAMAIGCKPKIGDECQISTDCSAAGDRLCDITAPGGYCTVFNCEPGACPEDESLCVQFGWQRSPICEDRQSPSPYARAFCMATCEETSDCRDGYVCEDVSDTDNEWGALLIDRDRGNRACLVRVTADPVTTIVDPDNSDLDNSKVCEAELAGPEPEPEPEAPEPEADPSAGGAGGEGAGGQGTGGNGG